MRNKLAVLLFTFSLHIIAFSQRTNPVIFLDGDIGHASGPGGGMAMGASLNYQVKQVLLSAQYRGNNRMKAEVPAWFMPIPVPMPVSDLESYAALAGYRKVVKGISFGAQTGVSLNKFTNYIYSDRWNYTSEDTRFVGFPFEASIKFFKQNKVPYRIYGLFPVGPATGFGGSVGFKLFGSVSEYPYAGFTIALGLGFHKRYFGAENDSTISDE